MICEKKRREFTNDLIARMQKFSGIQKKAYKELNIFWKASNQHLYRKKFGREYNNRKRGNKGHMEGILPATFERRTVRRVQGRSINVSATRSSKWDIPSTSLSRK